MRVPALQGIPKFQSRVADENHTYLRQLSKRSRWLVSKRWSCSATNETLQSVRDASSLIPLGVKLSIIFELVSQRFSLLAAPPHTTTKPHQQ